jgi:hypothetical protein
MSRRNFPFLKPPLRTQTTFPFIGDLPGGVCCLPGGEPPVGSANLESPSPACSLQTSIPRRVPHTLEGLADGEGGLRLGGAPAGKWKGAFGKPLVPQDRFNGFQRALPLVSGPGADAHGERGGLKSSRKPFAGEFNPGGRPTKKDVLPFFVPP